MLLEYFGTNIDALGEMNLIASRDPVAFVQIFSELFEIFKSVTVVLSLSRRTHRV